MASDSIAWRGARPSPMRLIAVALLYVTIIWAGVGCAKQSSADDSSHIQVSSSRIHSLLLFTLSVAEMRYGDPQLRELLVASEHHSLTESEAIRRLKKINIDQNSYAYPGLPRWHGATVQPFDAYLIASADVETIEDLGKRVAGVLPASDHFSILDAMRALEEAHWHLIWKSHVPALRELNLAIEARAEEVKLRAVIGQLAWFYGSPEAGRIPYSVSTSPLVRERGFRVTVKGPVIVAPIPSKERNVDKLMGIVVHETAHVAFVNQSPELAKAVRAWFARSGVQSQHYAYMWFDEALATAAGNIWARERFSGGAVTEPVHANPVVSVYARALSAHLSENLAKKMALDEAFVVRSAREFERAFPNALSNPNVILPYLTVHLNEGSELEGAISQTVLREIQPSVFSIARLRPGQAPNFTNPGTHLVVVDERSNFGPEPQASPVDFQVADGQVIITILARTPEQFRDAWKALKERSLDDLSLSTSH